MSQLCGFVKTFYTKSYYTYYDTSNTCLFTHNFAILNYCLHSHRIEFYVGYNCRLREAILFVTK